MLPRAREKEREEDTVCSVVHNLFSRDVISEIHTRETSVSYVTQAPNGEGEGSSTLSLYFLQWEVYKQA